MKNGKIDKSLVVFLILVIIAVLWGIWASIFNTKYQHLKNLNYDIVLNNDGSMDITETWDIQVSHTNTLFRNFEKTSNYSSITNVTVKDLDTGMMFTPTSEYAYHVQDDCFYALDVDGNLFEIAWGTGLENKLEHKRYEIKYTVIDAVNSYPDCDEIYWKLLNSSNGIPAKRVTGKITLPKAVKSLSNLYVWGHGPLNGDIQRKDNKTVVFNIDYMDFGRMLEIRVVTSEKIFDNISKSKIFDYANLDNILKEEKAFASTLSIEASFAIFWNNFLKFIGAIIIIYNIIKIIIYYIKYKKKFKIPEMLSKYYREIPGGDSSTPGEAGYLYFYAEDFNKNNESSMVAGTILDLATRKQIKLDCKDYKVFVTIIGNGNDLKVNERIIFNLLKRCAGKNKEFEISELKTYAKKEFFKYSDDINSFVNSSRESLYRQKFVDKTNENIIVKSKDASFRIGFVKFTSIVLLIALVVCFIPLVEDVLIDMFSISYLPNYILFLEFMAPYLLTVFIKNTLLAKMHNKIAAITELGYEMKNKWDGLVNFMRDFSLIQEKTVPDLILWEKYLVFATTFGISKEVIKQMKAKYPEVFINETWEDKNLNVIKFFNDSGYFGSDIAHATTLTHISESISSARSISTAEIAHYNATHSSSGGGRWRWLLRWRRRPVVAVAGMGGR